MSEYINGQKYYTYKELKPIFEMGAILDATKGGLILGNFHEEYGVKLIRESYQNRYKVIAEVEGYEYLLSPFASKKYSDRLKEINSELANCKDEFAEYDVPHYITKLDAQPMCPQIKTSGKLLLIGKHSQFVVNKYSTKKYIKILDIMNKENNQTNLHVGE